MVLGIYCAGNLGREIYDIAARINAVENRWNEIIFIDDVYDGDQFYGARVLRPTTLLDRLDDIEVVIANGTPVNRMVLREKVGEFGFRFTNLIDPTAIVSPTAILGQGIIITPYSTVCSNAIIKENVLIQSYVRIGHDIIINEDSVLSSNVAIGGKTQVGNQTYVGLGAVIKDCLKIGNNAIISMGAVVHTDVDDNVIVVGLPARVSKKNEKGKVFG